MDSLFYMKKTARIMIYPEPLANWNLDSAKAPAVRSIAKRSVLMQYGPLCDRSNPGALAQSKFQFANRSGYITFQRAIKFLLTERTVKSYERLVNKKFQVLDSIT